MSAVSEATNPVPWGVIVAANVGQEGPSSAGLALFECRPLHLSRYDALTGSFEEATRIAAAQPQLS
jgi:hypothetical protein